MNMTVDQDQLRKDRLREQEMLSEMAGHRIEERLVQKKIGKPAAFGTFWAVVCSILVSMAVQNAHGYIALWAGLATFTSFIALMFFFVALVNWTLLVFAKLMSKREEMSEE